MKTQLAYLLATLALPFASAFAHDFALHEVKTEIAGKATSAFSLNGKILYTFEVDQPGTRSVCTGVCAEVWPPILVTDAEAKKIEADRGAIEVENVDGSETDKAGFSVVNRGSATAPRFQLAFNGWPLYFYAFDRSEDDAYGDERNPTGIDAWYAFTADFVTHE